MNNYKFLPRQSHRSPTQRIKTLRNTFNIHQLSNQFVPFVQQRDTMGRLIKKKQSEQPNSPLLTLSKQASHQLLSTQLSQSPQKSLSLKAHQVQQNINREFQYKIYHQISVGDKNKVPFRKNSIEIHVRKSSEQVLHLPLIRESEQYFVQQNKLRKGSETLVNTEPSSPLLQNNASFIQAKTKRRMSMNKLQGHQQMLNKIKPQEKHQNYESRKTKMNVQKIDEKVPKFKIIVPQSYVDDKIKKREINELNRYNTFKTLNIKLADRLDQGHRIFLQKMRETKKLAFKIKMTLQST